MRAVLRRLAVALVLVCLQPAGMLLAQGTTLRMVSWNVESGDSSVPVLAQRVRSLGNVDVWGLSEVQGDEAAAALEAAAEAGAGGADFERVVGTTGGADRLVVLYNRQRLEKVRSEELHDINPNRRVRSPLVVQLRLRDTGSEFLVMVNHLYRSSSSGRHQQARQLNEWGRQQRIPAVLLGDYNFDWSVPDGDTDHDRGFDLLTDGGVFTWVRPARLVPSQCDPGFRSILDFVFLSANAEGWRATSEILEEPGDCPDTPTTSDHRPVAAMLVVDGGTPPPETPRSLRERILQRIEALEAELRELRELVNQIQ